MPSLEDLTTDQLLARARELEQQDVIVKRLMSDPEAREVVQRQLKKIDPKISIPEIDASDRFEKKLDEERQARLKLERQIQEDQIRSRLERQRAEVMTRYGLTEEDMPKVEALITDKDNPIPTYDAAARVYKASVQSATPTPAHFVPPTFQMPENDVWGKGIGNPAKLNQVAMEESYKAFNEIMQGKVAGLGGARPN